MKNRKFRLKNLENNFQDYNLTGVAIKGVCFVEVRDLKGGFVGLKRLTDLRGQLR